MELNSTKNTILVFSDPHQDIDTVKFILEKENYDQVVCLGDWFDSKFHQDLFHTEKTCEFLSEFLFKENFFTCIGNHDIQYLYDNESVLCGGYSEKRKKIINKFFKKNIQKVREKFLWYIWIDDYFCSHAGLNEIHFSPYVSVNKKDISDFLNKEIEISTQSLLMGKENWLYMAGLARGGFLKKGGITWQDFRKEFYPIEGLKQIVGHTRHKEVSYHEEDSLKENICIDCDLIEYIKFFNQNISVQKYSNL